jgi:hypothetical protein
MPLSKRLRFSAAPKMWSSIPDQQNSHCNNTMTTSIRSIFDSVCRCFETLRSSTQGSVQIAPDESESVSAAMSWLKSLFSNSMPEMIGGLAATATVAAATWWWQRRRRRRKAQSMQAIIGALLPRSMQSRFTHRDRLSHTEDDEAGLALVAALIEHKARKRIEVIGRGVQWGDGMAKIYLRAVIVALMRGVAYRRILVIDEALPQNGVLWICLLERFECLKKYRGDIALIPVKAGKVSGLTLQFQLIDRQYMHWTNRNYIDGQPGAMRRAVSTFGRKPHAEVDQYARAFDENWGRLGQPVTHREMARDLQELLAGIDATRGEAHFHSQLVIEASAFLDNLGIDGMPKRGLSFVGALMPHTFTYAAARKFTSRADSNGETMPMVVLPFRTLDAAIQAFLAGQIEYVCVPSMNSTIDKVAPPTVSEQALSNLRTSYKLTGSVDVDVSFCIAQIGDDPADVRRLVAVDAAYEQVKSELGPEISGLFTDRSMSSNFQAAFRASQDVTVACVTTHDASAFFGLKPMHGKERIGNGVTRFEIFSR